MSALPQNAHKINMPPGRRAALQRRNSLAKIARLRHGQEMTNGLGWALLMANVLEALGEYPNESNLEVLAKRLGIKLGEGAIQAGLDFRVDRQHGYGPGGRLVSAQTAGSLLELTWLEREAAEVIDIDAVDEAIDQRKRRLDAAGQARRRAAAGIKPASQVPSSFEKEKPWEAAGVSRRTWYRHRAKSGGTENVVRPSCKDLVIEHSAPAHASKNTTRAVPKAKAAKPIVFKKHNVNRGLAGLNRRTASKPPRAPFSTSSATAGRGT